LQAEEDFGVETMTYWGILSGIEGNLAAYEAAHGVTAKAEGRAEAGLE
jgi:hypothetical protein